MSSARRSTEPAPLPLTLLAVVINIGFLAGFLCAAINARDHLDLGYCIEDVEQKHLQCSARLDNSPDDCHELFIEGREACFETFHARDK